MKNYKLTFILGFVILIVGIIEAIRNGLNWQIKVFYFGSIFLFGYGYWERNENIKKSKKR
jgi:hypothetical protein